MSLLTINSNLEQHLKHTNIVHGGPQYIFMFPNGYGASVISNMFSYGGNRGLFELAVLDKDENICYDTPITQDVIGFLTTENVLDILFTISNFPAVEQLQLN